MFPEGTRSRGRGLMPFKTGAFHAALSAGVPVVPICVTNTHNKVKLNRWDNGHVIVEMLAPIDTASTVKSRCVNWPHIVMTLWAARLKELDAEVAEREAARKHG